MTQNEIFARWTCAHRAPIARIILEKLSHERAGNVIESAMRMLPDRAVLTVTHNDGVWRVEHDGEPFGHSREKEVAKAAASRHARTMMDSGRACEVRVRGENAFRGT